MPILNGKSFNSGGNRLRVNSLFLDLIIKYITSILEMLTASVENMLVTRIDTTLETGIVPTQYIVIISIVRRQSEVGIQRWNDVGPIVKGVHLCKIFEKSIFFLTFFASLRYD